MSFSLLLIYNSIGGLSEFYLELNNDQPFSIFSDKGIHVNLSYLYEFFSPIGGTTLGGSSLTLFWREKILSNALKFLLNRRL
jgi:hypothetical protein